MTSTFNWDDISINNENPETFFGKRHIKHERIYYDLVSSREIPKKNNHPKEDNKENVAEIKQCDKPKVQIHESEIIKLNEKCNNQLKISDKQYTSSTDAKPVKLKDESKKGKSMLPPARPKSYDYAEIYKKRKEIKAIEAVQNVVQPPSFKSKPLPTFYRSSKTATNAKPNRITVPITPMVLKRSTNNKKLQ